MTDILSPLYASGTPVETLGDAIEATTQRSTGQRVKSESRFWSTPSRPQSSTVREVFEVTFNSPQRINYIDFMLARFPQFCYAQWFDSNVGVWKNCTRPDSRTATESVSITNSVPAVINPAVAQNAAHPQHYGAGHWVSRQLAIAPVTTTKIRLVLARQPGVAPKDVYGNAIPYSLGVKDLTAGYAVQSKEDAPRLPIRSGSLVEHEPFLRTQDVLGSPTEYFIREIRAGGLLEGRPWRCAPQPTSNAVVNLHLDVRGTDGQGQVVNRFSIDPLYSGPTMNLYYTEDVPQGDFESGTTPMINGAVGDFYAGPSKELDGMLFTGEGGAFFYITNEIPQIDTSQPYTIHMSLQMGFDSADPYWDSNPGSEVTIFSFLSGLLSWKVDSTDTSIRGFKISGAGASYSLLPLDFVKGDIVNISIHSDSQNLVMVLNDTYSVSTSRDGYSGFGFSILGSIFPAGMGWKLLRLAIHEESPSEEAVASFNADPEIFVDGSEYYQDSTGHERNAVLRYSPKFIVNNGVNDPPYGFVGGRGEAVFDIEWIPINRDFSLRRGIVEFDPVKATYFKFEFTNLVPEPYEVIGSVWREIKVFPETMQVAHEKAFTLNYSGHEGGSGIKVSQSAASLADYPDSARIFYQLRRSDVQSPYAPTEVIYSSDPTIAARLRSVGGYFNFTPWRSHRKARFWRKGKHEYTPVKVKFEQRIAYFAGLKSLSMMRVDYTADDDTARYVDHFLDDTFIESGASDWIVSGGVISTPSGGAGNDGVWVAESRTLESRSNVVAVQFATVQTPAQQILPDPDFTEGDTHWRWYGDAEVSVSNEYNGILGSALKIVRGGLGSSWDALEYQYPSWDELEDSDPSPLAPTWATIQTDPDGVDYGGVISPDPVNAKPGETIHAAVRVYADRQTTLPVTIEIFDWTKPEVVYASASVTPKPGEISEWYVSYRVGNSGDYDGLSWGHVTSDPDALPNGDDGSVLWNEIEATGSWSDIEQAFTPFEGEVGIRVVQNGYSRDSFYVDNISAYVDSIAWEFSNDGGVTFTRVEGIRNNPRGIFVFPDPSPTAGGLRWRVTGYRSGLSVGGLVIRPHYDSMPMGVPYRESSQIRGPIDSAYDHMPPITSDPWFRLWDSPVPQDWWYNQRQWLANTPVLG